SVDESVTLPLSPVRVDVRGWPLCPTVQTTLRTCSATLLGHPGAVQPGIDPVGVSHELGMRAALDDPAAIDDDDLVGGLGGRHPVRDGDRRTTGHEPLEGAADPHLELGVD